MGTTSLLIAFGPRKRSKLGIEESLMFRLPLPRSTGNKLPDHPINHLSKHVERRGEPGASRRHVAPLFEGQSRQCSGSSQKRRSHTLEFISRLFSVFTHYNHVHSSKIVVYGVFPAVVAHPDKSPVTGSTVRTL